MDVIEVTRKDTKFYRTCRVLVGVTVDLCQVKGRDVAVISVMFGNYSLIYLQHIRYT